MSKKTRIDIGPVAMILSADDIERLQDEGLIAYSEDDHRWEFTKALIDGMAELLKTSVEEIEAMLGGPESADDLDEEV